MKSMKKPAMNSIFNNIYEGKTILITGDTGFKGSWLSIWLTLLGANVVGYADSLPSKPCMFSICKINKQINHIKGDIRDFDSLKKAFLKYKPDFIFHLAAQPIVNRAFLNPRLTFETNVIGTVNVLECMRKFSKNAVGVIITSDKCYKNMEWNWGYRETDVLGGSDPYSSSKACAELVCHAYHDSFFDMLHKKCRIVTGRAGNVIGGGDWAVDRIIPDCIRAWSRNNTVYIRNPNATRPWQHVLEPLSGYLWLGVALYHSDKLNGESFNFGPDYKVSESVGELIKVFSGYFEGGKWKYRGNDSPSKENLFLKVSCDKALKFLNWYALLSFADTIKITAEWYEEYYKNKNKDKDMLGFTTDQIEYYVLEAKKQGLTWSGCKP